MNFLLFRGLVRDQRHWARFPEILKKTLPNAKLFFLDFPGVGTEYRRVSPTTIPGIRADLSKRFHANLENGTFPKGEWNLLTISLGGMVGMDWVDHEPDLFRRFILVNSSARDAGNLFERFNPKIIPEMLRAVATMKPEISEPLILKFTSNRPQENTELAQRMIEWRKETPITRATFLAQIMAGAKFRLPKPPKPKTVVINSLGDRLVSPSCSKNIAERFGAEFRSHPWGGHDLPLDDPEWLSQQVAEFVKV